jgi:hypothetical protein
MERNRLIYTLIILLLFFLTSCVSRLDRPTINPTVTLPPELMDRSLLTGEPCPAPCWYRLELGKTNKEEALARVKTLSFVDASHISERESQYSSGDPLERAPSVIVSLLCKQPRGDICAELEFVDNILMAIYPRPNYPVNFGDMVEHLGPPDYFRMGSVYPDRPQQCLAVLIWKERGVWASYLSNPNEEGNQVICGVNRDRPAIRPSFPVEQIIYALPEDAIFVQVPIPGSDHPWNGFSDQ